MNDRTHRLTTTITLLLVAAQKTVKDFEYRVYEIIQRLLDLSGWSDEKRADLYARLVESVGTDDKMLTIEKKVDTALWKNEAAYA